MISVLLIIAKVWLACAAYLFVCGFGLWIITAHKRAVHASDQGVRDGQPNKARRGGEVDFIQHREPSA